MTEAKSQPAYRFLPAGLQRIIIITQAQQPRLHTISFSKHSEYATILFITAMTLHCEWKNGTILFSKG